MNKMIMRIALSVLVLTLFAGCASKPAPAAKPASYAEVYAQLKKDLVLDGAKRYTVVAGDALSKITESFYGKGNAYYFPLIMGASCEVVTHPDKIQPGMVLTIPDLEKNLKNPATVKSMKIQFRNVAEIYRGEGNASIADKLMEIANKL